MKLRIASITLASFLPHVAAVLTAVVFLQAPNVLADEPVIFRPAFAPAPADNPLKGFVPYAGQGRKFPHSLEFNYLPLASMMTGPTNFNWTPLERLLDGIASRGYQSTSPTHGEGMEWREYEARRFRGFDVILGYDPDETGLKFLEKSKAALTPHVRSLSVMHLSKYKCQTKT